MSRSSLSFIDRHRVDDTDDCRVDRRRLAAERFARGPAFQHNENFLVDAGADAVHREQRAAARRVVDVQRLHEQQLRPFERAMLLRRDDRADHSPNLHLIHNQNFTNLQSLRNPHSAIPNLFKVPVIHDSDDPRVDGRLDRIERKAGFFTAHEEHLFADSGADRIDRDEGTAGGLASRRQRLDEQELDAGQVLVLPRRHDVADHARELHQSLTSTVSMMPTMAASTGQSFMPDAIRAELPLTMSTVSPTPASTVSTATR